MAALKWLFDVDGVSADCMASMLEKIGAKATESDIVEWGFEKFLDEREKAKAYELFEDPNFWRELPVKEGAKKVINLIKDLGHEVVWVTSPWRSCFGWANARRAWIEEHFGDDSVIITSDKYHIPGDVFVDDKPDNVEKWKKAHPEKLAIIFDAPWNRDYHGATRMNWDSIQELL